MLASLIALAVAQANPAPPPLDLEQQALMRCSAALGLEVARAGHDPEGRFATRAREFFVRASVRLIDETGRTRRTGRGAFVECHGRARRRMGTV